MSQNQRWLGLHHRLPVVKEPTALSRHFGTDTLAGLRDRSGKVKMGRKYEKRIGARGSEWWGTCFSGLRGNRRPWSCVICYCIICIINACYRSQCSTVELWCLCVCLSVSCQQVQTTQICTCSRHVSILIPAGTVLPTGSYSAIIPLPCHCSCAIWNWDIEWTMWCRCNVQLVVLLGVCCCVARW